MQLVSSAATVNSAVSSGATSQLSCPVNCVEPLPSMNSILPSKLWAVVLVAINQGRVHAVTFTA